MYLDNEPSNCHPLSLSNTMNTHNSLLLHSRIPPWILQQMQNIGTSKLYTQVVKSKHVEHGNRMAKSKKKDTGVFLGPSINIPLRTYRHSFLKQYILLVHEKIMFQTSSQLNFLK